MNAGTQNIYCQGLQFHFTDEEESFLYVRLTRNQRIDAFKTEKVQTFLVGWFFHRHDYQWYF